MISPDHLEHLKKSAITKESAEKAGLTTLQGDAVRKILDWPEDRPADKLGSCLCFPYPHYWSETYKGWKSDGSLIRVRPDKPRHLPDGRSKFKPAKYENPAGSPLKPYVPREWADIQDNQKKTLIITEGEKKALSLNAHGWPAIGLPGIWSFRTADRKHLQPEILALARPGRRVLIAFDADFRQNPQVLNAAALLASYLSKNGCDSSFYVTPSWVQKKGVDDQLAAWGAEKMAQRLADWARPHDVEDWTNALLEAVFKTKPPKAKFLEEVRIAGQWLQALLKKEKKPDREAKLKEWTNKIREIVSELYSLTNVEIYQVLTAGSLPQAENPDEPWEIVVDGMVREFRFDDENSWLPAGDHELLGTSHTDAARFLVGKWNLPTVFVRGSVRQYEKGVWVRRTEQWVQREILALNKERTHGGQEIQIQKTTADGIQACLGRYLAFESDSFWNRDKRRWLAFLDLSVSWNPKKGELETQPHNPLHRTELKFQTPWKAAPGVQEWEKALLDWCHPDPDRNPDWTETQLLEEMVCKANLVKYWIGASVLMGARYVGKALALVGGPGTGKSTFCGLISNLWPEDRVTAIPLQKLGEEYPAADLAESALNVVSELPATKAADVEAIKSAITCSDRMYARRIYGATFSFVPTASHLVGMNSWPALRDYSGAIWDRFYTVRFENRYRDTGKENKNIRENLEKEISGILISCLHFTTHYLKTKSSPPIPITSREEIQDAQESSDPISEWINSETLSANNGQGTKQKELFKAYLTWADENKRGVISSKKFSLALKTKGILKKRISTGMIYPLVMRNPGPSQIHDEIENIDQMIQ